jgi:hypothetical protein
MKVRRIVTGYNAAGEAVVKTDEQLTAVPRVGAGIKGCEIWSTDEMPVRQLGGRGRGSTGWIGQAQQFCRQWGWHTFHIIERNSEMVGILTRVEVWVMVSALCRSASRHRLTPSEGRLPR